MVKERVQAPPRTHELGIKIYLRMDDLRKDP